MKATPTAKASNRTRGVALAFSVLAKPKGNVFWTNWTIREDRKEEINFYYSIMIEIESADGHIETIDNNRLVKIMKSNLLLMLYNLVEACVVSGMMEIYEDLKNDGYLL